MEVDGVLGWSVALGIGLLIGVERERRAVSETGRESPAGVRTHALAALTGALAQALGVWVLAAAVLGVAGLTLASYRDSRRSDPGLTSEIALLATFMLGAFAQVEPRLAAALGVVIAVVLASKDHLHRFTRNTLTERELNDGLLFAASVLVVLPALPSDALDPWGVLNLRKLWTIVVLVMAIGALGHVALRMAGARLGLVLSGLFGGFISSTATFGSMGSRARLEPQLLTACAAGALASNMATVILLAAIVGGFSLTLLIELVWALGAMALATLLTVLMAGRELRRTIPDDALSLSGRAFSLGHALLFAGVIAIVMLITALLQSQFGNAGAQMASAVAGLADAHAAAASVAQLANSELVSAKAAAVAVLIGVSTNTLSKVVAARAAGGGVFMRKVLPGLALMLIAAWAGYFGGRLLG